MWRSFPEQAWMSACLTYREAPCTMLATVIARFSTVGRSSNGASREI